jgi:hypothetical protein
MRRGRIYPVTALMALLSACGGPPGDEQNRGPATPPNTVAGTPPRETTSVASTSSDTLAVTFSDLDGFYVLREPVKVGLGPYVILALTLAPGVTLVQADDRGDQTTSQCREQTVLPDTLHVVCQLLSAEIVSMDGHFLGRRTADGLVVSVPPDQDPYRIDVLTVLLRVSRRGETLYLKRHAFTFRPGE